MNPAGLPLVSRLNIRNPTGAHLEEDRFPVGSILEVMTVLDARFEPRTIARPQEFLSRIRHQHHLTLDDEHKLILQ